MREQGSAPVREPVRTASFWSFRECPGLPEGSGFEERTVGLARKAGTIHPGEDSLKRPQPPASPAPEIHGREPGRQATALSRSGATGGGEQEES